MPTYVPPKRATALIFYTGLISQANTHIFQVAPTLATGDVKVSIDGGTLNNLATLPVVTPAGGKVVMVSLSVADMTGDNIVVVFSDAEGAQWQDQVIAIQTSTKQIDDLSTVTTAQVNTECDSALSDYDPPTKTEMDTALTGMSTVTTAQVNAACDTALADYDGPTKAEMDAGLAGKLVFKTGK